MLIPTFSVTSGSRGATSSRSVDHQCPADARCVKDSNITFPLRLKPLPKRSLFSFLPTSVNARVGRWTCVRYEPVPLRDQDRILGICVSFDCMHEVNLLDDRATTWLHYDQWRQTFVHIGRIVITVKRRSRLAKFVPAWATWNYRHVKRIETLINIWLTRK